ncbi:MAG: hypothetical protein M0P71_01385 [Melioribacteraceae bacterium]|nr:hypothetical protein [Melioribacteraceae bacterium]
MDNVFAVRHPTTLEIDNSRIISWRKKKELEKKCIPTREQMKDLLIKKCILSNNFYNIMDFLEKQISSLNETKRITNSEFQINQINSQIENYFNQLRIMENKEASMMTNTIEYLVEDCKTNYILSQCLLCGLELNTKYWNSYSDFCKEDNIKLITESKKNFINLLMGIPVIKIRAVARNNGWRKRWNASKKTGTPVFEGSSSSWDKNKINLCYWTDFYDNIFEYKNPPPDEVLNDDEKLFDWIRKINKMNSSGGEKNNGENVNINTPYKVRV